jgi:hypothetical protein
VAPPATPPPENTPAKSGAEDLDKAGAKVPANKSDGRFGGLEKELDSQSK